MGRKIPLLTLVLLLFAAPAQALDMEYYTYNGFNAVVDAFSKIALIFSDTNYRALFFSIIVLGILLGAMTVYFMALSGMRVSVLSWAWPVGIGVTLYLALILPKGTLHIYDPVKNQYQPVGGIPDGLVAVIGTLNTLERGLVDIVSTASDPVGFQQEAGGVGFDMLLNVSSRGVLLTDQYINESLRRYVEDCVYFELTRPGTTLTINALANNSDFVPLFQLAANPAIYTVFYQNSVPQGTSMTCAAAMSAIQTAISDPTQYDNTSKARCAEAGFDPAIPVEYNQCLSLLGSLVSWFEGAAFSTTQIYRQTLIGQTINDVVLDTSPDTAIQVLAGRDAGTSLLSTGVMANEWIPMIRAVTTAIAIGMLPFLVIFIPTPLFGKAIGVIVGFFIWLTAWGVTDAVSHQFALDYAQKAFQEVKEYQLGVTAISAFGTASLKTLAAFGAIRWSGLMLATVITTLLIRFGGHALDTLAGQMTAAPLHAGQSAGRLATPEGQAGALRSLEDAPPVIANAYKFDYLQRTQSRTHQRARGVGEGLGLGAVDGAFEVGEIQGQSSRGSARAAKEFAGEVAGGDVVGATAQSSFLRMSRHYGSAVGRVEALKSVLGIESPYEAARFEGAGGLVTEAMAAHAESQGIRGVIPGMRLVEAGVDPKTGQASYLAFAGAVTEANVGALKTLYRNNGQEEIARDLKPGMIARYSVDPGTGRGTFQATDSASAQSEGIGEKTINPEKGLIVDTPHGRYEISAGKIHQEGGQVAISGTTAEGKSIVMKGALADLYEVVPGSEAHPDGTSTVKIDPEAGRDSQGFPVKNLIKDNEGDIVSLGLNLARAEVDRGIYSKETAGPAQVAALSAALEGQGAPRQVVNTLKYLADQNRSAEVEMSSPVEGGGPGRLSVRAGGEAIVKDFALSQAGWEEVQRAYSSSLSGSREVTMDVRQNIVEHGVSIGSAMQMALSRDPALASFISDHTLNKYKPEAFEANVAETAKDLARDVGGFISRQGSSVGFLEGRVSGGLGNRGLSGSIGTGRQSRESEGVNLLASQYDRLLRESVAEAKEQGLDKMETQKHVAGKVGDFTKEIYDRAKTSTSRDYGADAPIGAIEKLLKEEAQ